MFTTVPACTAPVPGPGRAMAKPVAMAVLSLMLLLLSCWLPALPGWTPQALSRDGLSTVSARPDAAVASLARDMTEHLPGAAAPDQAPLPLHAPVDAAGVLLHLDDLQGSEGLQQQAVLRAADPAHARRGLPPDARFSSAHPLRADRPPTA